GAARRRRLRSVDRQPVSAPLLPDGAIRRRHRRGAGRGRRGGAIFRRDASGRPRRPARAGDGRGDRAARRAGRGGADRGADRLDHRDRGTGTTERLMTQFFRWFFALALLAIAGGYLAYLA